MVCLLGSLFPLRDTRPCYSSSQFAKEQLQLLLTYQYQTKRSDPAYEWEFSDLNPPVQAWAALKLYEMDPKRDLAFLEMVFSKLLVNFTWWKNKVDKLGNNFSKGDFWASIMCQSSIGAALCQMERFLKSQMEQDGSDCLLF